MTDPFDFQIKDVRRLHIWGGRGILAHEQGLGKTVSSFLFRSRHPDDVPAVVVCPATVKYHWQVEGRKHFGFDSAVLEGTRPSDRLPDAQFYILNYDILGRRRSDKTGEGWLQLLKEKRPQLLIIDEVQKVANRNTLAFKAVKALSLDVPHVLALSGTPFTNRPIELWAILNIVRPELFPSYHAFAHRYCGPKRNPWSGGWDYTGASNLDELHRILTDRDDGVMLRRRKVDVLQDLPAKVRSVVPVPMSNPKEYRLALKDFKSWLRMRAPGRMKRAWNAKALTHVSYLKRLAAELKLPAAFRWIDDHLDQGGGKLIVFGIHKKILGPVYERYKDSAVLVDGSVTGRKRHEAIDRFNLDKNTRLFVGNIRAAGAGWSARDCSSTCFLEIDYVPGLHSQAEDRTHGISRGRAGHGSVSYYILARGTVEEKLCSIIHRKQKVINSVLDAGEGDEFDLLDQLLKEMMEEV